MKDISMRLKRIEEMTAKGNRVDGFKWEPWFDLFGMEAETKPEMADKELCLEFYSWIKDLKEKGCDVPPVPPPAVFLHEVHDRKLT
ncbi:MAG: hypothetical protein PQJ59_12800 [Spirochaetales bacterium]|nr:hypothetical protein [Spirochaetales bacterium]